jgi:hypothetical protein
MGSQARVYLMATATSHAVWIIACLPLANAAIAAEVSVLPPVEVKGSYDNSVGTSDAASQGAVNREARRICSQVGRGPGSEFFVIRR